MLMRAIELSEGPILELGSGLFSTPLIHWMCHKEKRPIVTYESVEEYYKFAKEFRSANHKVRKTEDYEDLDLKGHWGVVLIDHTEDRRAIDTVRLKDKADYIVLHDSECDLYEYATIFSHFKHVHHWKECKPWTSVVSNFKELTDFE